MLFFLSCCTFMFFRVSTYLTFFIQLLEMFEELKDNVLEKVTLRAALFVAVPWICLGLFAAYHFFRQLRARRHATPAILHPICHFYSLLTSGATAGYDKEIFQLFHPSLMGKADKGLIRGMMRYMHYLVGPLVEVPPETVVVKQDGLQVNTMSLIHFEKQRNVRCQLHWIMRPALARGDFQRLGEAMPFHVMSFHVDVPPNLKRNPRGGLPSVPEGEELTVMDFIDLNDFLPVGEKFVQGLLRPDFSEDFVQLLVQPLSESYQKEMTKQEKLKDSIQATIQAAGRFKGNDPDIQLMTSHFLYEPEADDLSSKAEEDTELTKVRQRNSSSAELVDNSRSKRKTGVRTKAIRGFAQVFLVPCNCRDIEVEIHLTLVDSSCRVFNFEVRLLPDHRKQILLDKDTGVFEHVNN